MDYAGAVLGSLAAAAVLAWWNMSIPHVIMLSAVPGMAVLMLLAALPNPATVAQIDSARGATRPPPKWNTLSPALRGYLKVLAIFCFAKASEAFIVLRGHELALSTVTLLLLWAWLAALQSATALVSELADPQERGTAFGWYHMIAGLVAIPAGLLFGLVWKLVGPAAAFGLTALVALASATWLKLSLPAPTTAA